MKLVIGLGNPGKQYEHTRHNVGFMVVERLARQWGVDGKPQARFQAIVGEGHFKARKVLLVQPTTFMNLSGRSVRALLDFYKASTEDLLVVYDDFALPLGSLRLRLAGTAGGHNGLTSIIQDLGTNRFPRLRVGIGPLPPGWSTINYVLGRFGEDEDELLSHGVQSACEAIELGLSESWDAAMTRYNRRDDAPEKATRP